MNCFECAKTGDVVPAVGLCGQCSAGLCFDHLIEARAYRVGGTTMGSKHDVPHENPVRGLPVGIAARARHHRGAVS